MGLGMMLVKCSLLVSIGMLLAAWTVSAAPINQAALPSSKQWSFPLFQQCDPAWGNHTMGIKGPGEQATICREGCAMSSLSMALNGLGIHLPDGKLPNPGTLNNFLQKNLLYTCAAGDCNNLLLNAPEAWTGRLKLVGELPTPAYADMAKALNEQTAIMLAHVQNRTHFVLLIEPTKDNAFKVNDPFFNRTSYGWNEISDVIMYKIVDESTNVPVPYPLYKQCNSSWANDLMVNQTICSVGCLMSSTSMALHGKRILIDGKASDPAVLNHWLQHNGGYDDDNDLNEDVVPHINESAIAWPSDGMHQQNDLDKMLVRSYLLRGRVVIANVMHGRHFVLVQGYSYQDDDVLFINDPGFNRTTYSYSQDVVGWRIFDMLSTKE